RPGRALIDLDRVTGVRTELYWIESPAPGRLAIMPRPRGGDWLADEVDAWRKSGVAVVVSLLTEDEIAHFDLEQEAGSCQGCDMEFLSFPILDRGVPESRAPFETLVRTLADHLAAGKNVAVH